MKNTRLEQLRQFIADQPDDPFLKYALATEHLKAGDQTASLTYFKELLEEHPDYLGTYYHLGKLYEELGRFPDAIETYDKGIVVAMEQKNHRTRSELEAARNLLQE
ncbi:MAG TPA: tetratricopeptide repeat protein [Anseongella sp.]